MTAAWLRLERGRGLGVGGAGGLQVRLRKQPLRGERLRARELLAGVLDGGAGPLHVGLGRDQRRLHLAEPCLQQRRVEAGQHLALADDRVEVGVQRLDRPRDLRADLDRGHRLQRPGRPHHVQHVAAADGSGDVLHVRGAAAQHQPRDDGQDDDGQTDERVLSPQMHHL